MKIIVDKHTVTINKNEIVNEGEYNVQACNFEFSSEYDGLPKIAIFKTETVTKQILLSGDSCITPSEVLESTGIVGLGVYAYENDGDNLILRYSPTPAVFTVEPGSYDEGDAPTPPTPSVIEQLQEEITQNANNITSLQNITSDHTARIESIESEQITQNNQINANKNDISDIKDEQISQNAQIGQNKADIESLNGRLTNYSLITETGSQIALNVNSSNYQMTAILKDKNGNTIYTSNVIDLPIESMIIDIDYDEATKEIVFTLQSGTTLRVSVADLVSGLVSTDELNTILANYYTKTEIDTLLNAKANSSDVYTKNETDALLGGKVDTTAYTQGQATQDANIEENASNIEELQSIVDQLPHEEGEGTDIELEPTIEAKMSIGEAGNSSQFSTTGKQLLNLPNGTYSNNQVTALIKDGLVTLNGTANGTAFITISGLSIPVTADYYIWSANNPAINSNIILRFEDSASYMASSLNETNKTARYEFKESKTLTKFTIRVADGTSLNNFVIKPQFEQGSTATPYEPYTGGIPAPSPDYPFPVKSVTGENDLVINNVNYLPNELESQTINGVTVTVNEDKSIHFKGTPTAGFTLFLNRNQPNLKINQDYVISTNCVFPISSIVMRITDNSDNSKFYNISTNQSPLHFTYDGKFSSGKFQTFIWFSNGSVGTAVDFTVYPMLVKGSTAPTTYVEHEEQNYQLSFGNMELNSSPDGTIRDGIIGSPDNWFKREYIGKVVLDGSENWTVNGTGTPNYFYQTTIQNGADQSIPNRALSSHYILTDVFSSNTNQGFWTSIGSLRIRYGTEMTISDFKQWLSQNNVTVCYLKGSYNDIPITDTTLINQLNDIYNNAHSYKGTTNVTSTYEDGNEQMYLDASALTDISKKIDTLTNAIIELGGE